MAAAAAIDRALLTSGFSILAMREVMAPNIVGENAARLRGQLHAVLETLAPPGFLAGMGTIVVDDSLGREIPATLEELWPVCVRLNVPHVAMEGDVIALDAPMRSRIEQDLEVHVGCAVESVSFQGEHAVVCFKRYLPPTTLTLAETRLLVFLEDAPTVREIVRRCEGVHSGEEVLQVLRELEQKRVVNMDLPVLK